jgi:hypothetical protein
MRFTIPVNYLAVEWSGGNKKNLLYSIPKRRFSEFDSMHNEVVIPEYLESEDLLNING